VRPEPGGAAAGPTAPSSAYRSSGRRLLLPATLPDAVARAFGPAARRRQEACALLYGARGTADGDDTVCALVVPRQLGYRGRYLVPHAAVAAASAATESRGWVTLGQVHSHPSEDVEHSWYDDRNAVSLRAISIVVPRYGRRPVSWPGQAGVHEHQDGWWHLLDAPQSAARITLAAAPLQIIDLRDGSTEP
jgi:hypothetical protein